ncbi:MAG TPA: Bax inhibitor-1/YccA family protein [Candidatus Babeliales bacterium]|nr:Bax inhibitor-1/YccA family protein [Candidatus Babeliales bacterium]
MFQRNYSMSGSITDFMYKVYGWMAAGLALTAGTSYAIFQSPTLFRAIFGNQILFFGLIIAQFALVIALSGWVMRMSLPMAIAAFIGYSVLTGATLASIFYIYTATSIYLAFGVAAATFAVMALYGYFTQSDLTSIGSVGRMALFGMIIAMVINFFLKSAQLDYIISLIGVGLFTLLAAYDSQKIKQMGYALVGQGDVEHKAALIGALTMYLDFLNLFLFLLRILGSKRDE